jgi:hypothetical protein
MGTVNLGKDPDQWVEIPLDKWWLAAYRIGLKEDGELGISELRIFPRETDDRRWPGEWSAETLGYRAPFHLGGITTAILRGIRLGEHRTLATNRVRERRAIVMRVQKAEIEQGLLHGIALDVPDERRPGRPRNLSDQDILLVAHAYVEGQAKEPRRPRQFAAKRLGLSSERVRDLLHVARKRGFLSSTNPGYSGGGLTDLARKMGRPHKAKAPRSSRRA